MIYVDEAGTSTRDAVLVVASVLVEPDSQYRVLEKKLGEIADERVPSQIRKGFHFHAKELFNGGKQFSRDEWAFPDRLATLKAILNLIRDHAIPVAFAASLKQVDWSTVIAGLKEKRITPEKWDHAIAFSQAMVKADLFLRKYLSGSEIGVVVAEDVTDRRELLRRVGLFARQAPYVLMPDQQHASSQDQAIGRSPPPSWIRIDHIVDDPHFMPKAGGPLLGLADAAAFTLRRCLERQPLGDDLLREMLHPEDAEIFLSNEANFTSPATSWILNTRAYWGLPFPSEFR
ncbi:hypothetical protein C7I55_26215 [Sphingomonas deserti]|uniref:DUF3800 domain-containing protein n=2 Tax=Allosphingosinicella deserti TaxID=2116704 RepID=A0A2P7QF06_9SPHN|nr:hypothetical protein C7I55_26215 [Sphingomonas deserti]